MVIYLSPLFVMEFWNRNKVWICGSLALAAIFYILNKTGIYTELIAGTVYTGIFFLVLTLLPNNILKLQLPFLKPATLFLAKIVRYRRSLGIIAGLLILTHVMLVLLGEGAISLENMYIDWAALGMILFSKPVILGFSGAVILVLMLLTSSRLSERVLGKGWKPLQSLIWAIPPLALTHAYLAASELEGIVILGFGSIILLVLVELYIYIKRPPIDKRSYRRHVCLMTLGTIAAVAVLVWMK